MKQRIIKYIIVILLLLSLVSIRFFEKEIFNDGLIDFFKYDYLTKTIPDISWWKILGIDTLRYWTNSTISITIVYILFSQKGLLRFLLWFYLLLFSILLLLLAYYLYSYEEGHYLGVFYLRRILIHPLALFILIPALLYQKKEVTQ